jgi:Uri superfamily endonuclease
MTEADQLDLIDLIEKEVARNVSEREAAVRASGKSDKAIKAEIAHIQSTTRFVFMTACSLALKALHGRRLTRPAAGKPW